MEVGKPLLVVVVVVVSCVPMVNAANLTATMWCCPDREDGGGGCPAAAVREALPVITSNNDSVSVTWETRPLTCPPSTILAYHKETTFDKFTLQEQGDVIVTYVDAELFDKETREYCLEGDGEKYKIAVCQPDPETICGGRVCIPKCCGEGEVLNTFLCEKNESIPFQFYSSYGEALPAPDSYMTVENQVPVCEGEGSFYASLREFRLLVNGKLQDTDDYRLYDFDEYCIDHEYSEEGEVKLMATACNAKQSQAIDVKLTIMRVGYVISILFLIVTFLFHVFIPSLRDAQGLIFLSHMASLMVALTVLFIISVFSHSLSQGYCVFNGFLFLYFFLAMFFWLNVMCFDIWRVIRATAKGIPLVGILSSDSKKFKLYCLYAWGCPLLVTIAAAVMHLLPAEHVEGLRRPGFGEVTCLFSATMAHWIYCYAYVAALFILDVIFIGHTVITLCQAGSAFMCFGRQVSVTAFNRKHLEVFWQRLSVFVLMVFCWTTEVLSFKIRPQEIWIVTDIINSLQGFVIFLIFISVRKKRELATELLKKAVPKWCRRLPTRAKTTDNNTIATYQATSRSASASGPSGSTSDEYISKTDTKDAKESNQTASMP